MNIDKSLILVSVAVLFKGGKHGRKESWFLVKHPEEDRWEMPKVTVRKGESSVRAALRMIAEKGAMTTKVINEVGRAGGVTTLNGKILPQRYLYYFMKLRFFSKECVGFPECLWLEYAQAVKKVSSKREKIMLKQARKMYKKWRKEIKNKKN